MNKLDDYCILMEERQGKGLDTVVMEFFEKHPDYTLLGGPYIHNGLACQAVVKYEVAKRKSRKIVPLPPEIAEFVDQVNKACPVFTEEK